MNGNLIREYRLERGYTCGDLAKIMGVDRSAVGKWENHVMVPTPERRRKLRELFKEELERDGL